MADRIISMRQKLYDGLQAKGKERLPAFLGKKSIKYSCFILQLAYPKIIVLHLRILVSTCLYS